MSLRLAACLAIGVLTGASASASTLVLENATLIDGTGGAAQRHVTIVVEDDRIRSVSRWKAPRRHVAGEVVVDAAGKFVIPGLWDMHVHLTDVGEEAIPLLPTYGITSVRDMGGDVATVQGFRARIADGQLVGPRIKLCGPMLEGKWDPANAGGRTDHWAVANPAEAKAVVERLAAAGVDCIKMRSYANPETYFALAAAAKAHHLPLVGHAPWEIDPIEASNAGQRSFEHAFYPWPWKDVPPDRKLRIEETFRKNGSSIVPTLVAWDAFRATAGQVQAAADDLEGASDPRLKLVSAALRKNWTIGVKDMKAMNSGSPGWAKALGEVDQQVAEMHDHGVLMMAGTDSGAPLVYPGSALLRELELLVERCHFTPMDALRSATSIPARSFELEHELGTVEEGKLADLVVLGADPLRNIANLEKIDGVVLQGKWLDRAALTSIANGVAATIAARRSR